MRFRDQQSGIAWHESLIQNARPIQGARLGGITLGEWMRTFHPYRPYLVACRRMAIGTVFLGGITGLLLGGTDWARPALMSLIAFWCMGQIILARRFCYSARWFKNGSGTVVRSTLRAVPATVPDSFLNHEPPSILSRLGRWVELVAGNVAFAAVLAEFALRAFAHTAGAAPIVSDALEAYRLTPDHDYGAGLRGNRLGYPGLDWPVEKSPGRCRIAALGDSFSVGPAVAYDANYLTVLEQSLGNVELLNFGVAGTGPREYALILRQDVWGFQPDCVLLSIFVGNDITEELATPRKMDPRQSYLYLFLTRGSRLLLEARRSKSESKGEKVDRLSAGRMSSVKFIEVEQRRLAVCRPGAGKDMEKKWQRALTRLETIANECRKRQVPLACVLIPDEFQTNPSLLSEVLRTAGLSRADIDLDLPQRRLAAFFAQRDVPCLDLLPVFAGTTDGYALRDTHWNEAGNHRAAAAISGWLKGLPPFSQSACARLPPAP
jgi:hypothetical protein